MHYKGRIQPIDLSQIFVSIAAVISDPSVDAVAAHGCQEGHQATEAIAKDGNFAGALGQLGHAVGGVFNISGTGISVIGPIEEEAVLPVVLEAGTPAGQIVTGQS